MSLKLTTSLSQRLVLTPQLRQRIEMLQMTTLELGELIQQQLLENPVLEEVATQEEAQELAEKILDHLASTDAGSSFDQPAGDAVEPGMGAPSSNGTGELDPAVAAYADAEVEAQTESLDSGGAAELAGEGAGDEVAGDDAARDAFEEIDFGREFQDYLDPGYKTRSEEHTSELQSRPHLVCRLLLEKKKKSHLDMQI